MTLASVPSPTTRWCLARWTALRRHHRPSFVGTAHAARLTGGKWRKNKQRPGKRRRKEQTRPHDADSRRALAKAIDRDIASGVLNWQAPVEYSSAMKMTMVDRQTLPNDPKRLVLTTLRAKKSFQGRPTNDFVKVEVEDDNGQGRLYFAKCEAFFRDFRGDHYVGLRACYPLTPLLYNLEPSTFISRLNSVSARYF